MRKTILSRAPVMKREPSFSLIELLVVMAVIALLASLILAAGNGVFAKSQASRAISEIAAMGSALERYKTDNGIYPPNSVLLTNTYSSTDPSTVGGLYQQSSQALYEALSGQTNFLDTPGGATIYMSFKVNQLGNTTTAAGSSISATTSTYVKDPYKFSYGYSTGTTTSTPYNGNGFFDLWSTGGKSGTAGSNTNAWRSNWQ